MIYLDYSATTPMSNQALQVYTEVAKQYYGNPSSLHDAGGQAAQLLEACRRELASCFEGEARGVYFTGGGSESNDLALRSIAKAYAHKGKHIITSQVEHSSILSTCKLLEEEGYQVTYLPVNSYGEVQVEELQKAITSETILVSITYANSEIGTIQPINEIGKLLAEHGIIFHSDCVQAFGKIPIDIQKAKLHSISISSHKVYGPKVVGVCYISPEIRWQSVLPDTTHEKGFRQGTVNVPGIAAFVAAAQEAMGQQEDEAIRCRQLTTKLLEGMREGGWDIRLEGHPAKRLSQHLGIRIVGMEGQYAMLECNRYGLCISTGTACLVGQSMPSHTMLALGRTPMEAYEFIRITVGKLTTEEEIEQAIRSFQKMFQNYYKHPTNPA